MIINDIPRARLKLTFEALVSKPDEDMKNAKYIFITDNIFYADNLIDARYMPVYICPEQKAIQYPEVCFTLDGFIDYINKYGYNSRNFYYVPIASFGLNKQLEEALRGNQFNYSETAWKTFKSVNDNIDYYKQHTDELDKIVNNFINTCEGAKMGLPLNLSNEAKEKAKTGLVKMSTVTPQEVDWLWKPYIPLGKITLMRGDPGQGKTTVSLALSAIVSNGWAFPTESGFASTEPSNVLYITAEDGLADTIAPRLIKAKANLDRVFSYEETTLDQLSFMHPRFEDLLKEAQPRLVIVDPIQGYLGAGVDGHKANEVRSVMRHVGALAEKYNCAIILIEHMSKNMGTKGLYRGLGSIDTTAAARSVLLVGSNPEDESDKGISQIKSNLAKPGKVIGFTISDERGIEWKKETDLTTDMMLGAVILREDKPDNALEEAKDFLNDILSDGKQSSKDINAMAVQYGISKATLKRAKEVLSIDCTERTGFGKKTTVFWKLPYNKLFCKPEKTGQIDKAQIISIFDKQNAKQTHKENELH